MSTAILPLTQKREGTLIVWEIRSHNIPIWGWREIRKLATVVLPYVLWSRRSVRFPAHTCHAWAFYYSIIVFIFSLAPHLFIILSLCSSSHCVSNLARKIINLASLIRIVHLPVAVSCFVFFHGKLLAQHLLRLYTNMEGLRRPTWIELKSQYHHRINFKEAKGP